MFVLPLLPQHLQDFLRRQEASGDGAGELQPSFWQSRTPQNTRAYRLLSPPRFHSLRSTLYSAPRFILPQAHFTLHHFTRHHSDHLLNPEVRVCLSLLVGFSIFRMPATTRQLNLIYPFAGGMNGPSGGDLV